MLLLHAFSCHLLAYFHPEKCHFLMSVPLPPAQRSLAICPEIRREETPMNPSGCLPPNMSILGVEFGGFLLPSCLPLSLHPAVPTTGPSHWSLRSSPALSVVQGLEVRLLHTSLAMYSPTILQRFYSSPWKSPEF